MSLDDMMRELLNCQTKSDANRIINKMGEYILKDNELGQYAKLELIHKLISIKTTYGLTIDSYRLEDLKQVIIFTLAKKDKGDISAEINIKDVYLGFNKETNAFHLFLIRSENRILPLTENIAITNSQRLIKKMRLEENFYDKDLDMYFMPLNNFLNIDSITIEQLFALATQVKMFLESNPLFIQEAIKPIKKVKL